MLIFKRKFVENYIIIFIVLATLILGVLFFIGSLYGSMTYVGSPSLSANGRYLAFESNSLCLKRNAKNLRMSRSKIESRDSSLNNREHKDKDIFVYDLSKGELNCVSVNRNQQMSNGASDSPLISNDGHFVLFKTDATDIVQKHYYLCLRDIRKEITLPIAKYVQNGEYNMSRGNILLAVRYSDQNFKQKKQTNNLKISDYVKNYLVCVQKIDGTKLDEFPGIHVNALSDDGRYILVDQLPYQAHYTQLFRYDRSKGSYNLVSRASNGIMANYDAIESYSVISSDGRFVAFTSQASNIVPNDNNNAEDVFLYDCQTDCTTRISVASNNQEGNGNSGSLVKQGQGGECCGDVLAMSADGRYVAFSSYATNLVAGFTPHTKEVYLHDCKTGTTTCVSRDISDGYEAGFPALQISLSADGRILAFTRNKIIYIVDLNSHKTKVITPTSLP